MALFPGRKQLDANDPYSAIARGQQLSPDTSREGVVDDGNVAWPERIEEAKRYWVQADPADFEKTGKRSYVDRASGIEHQALSGAPLLCVGEATRGVACFLVEDGRLVVLRRSDFQNVLLGPTGYVIERTYASPLASHSGSVIF